MNVVFTPSVAGVMMAAVWRRHSLSESARRAESGSQSQASKSGVVFDDFRMTYLTASGFESLLYVSDDFPCHFTDQDQTGRDMWR